MTITVDGKSITTKTFEDLANDPQIKADNIRARLNQEAERKNGVQAITWRQLTELEPRLKDLLTEIKKVKDTGDYFCANAVWFGRGGYKKRLSDLAGWYADPHPIIATSKAFEVAYKNLYRALPDCRGCSCL